VDKAAEGVSRNKTQKPQNKQDDQDCPKHIDLLFFFRLSLSRAHPLLDGTMDWGEATRLKAVFMPESLRVLSMSGN
jgi:hypothetical protein